MLEKKGFLKAGISIFYTFLIFNCEKSPQENPKTRTIPPEVEAKLDLITKSYKQNVSRKVAVQCCYKICEEQMKKRKCDPNTDPMGCSYCDEECVGSDLAPLDYGWTPTKEEFLSIPGYQEELKHYQYKPIREKCKGLLQK